MSVSEDTTTTSKVTIKIRKSTNNVQLSHMSFMIGSSAATLDVGNFIFVPGQYTYNLGNVKNIEKTVNDIKNNTNYDYIVINDCSKDNTKDQELEYLRTKLALYEEIADYIKS
jgi:hypothetical protein